VTPQQALELGWSIIPVNRNKTPMLKSWKPYQKRRPTIQELESWLRMNPPVWGIVTGSISGRFTLDFDGEQGRQTMRKLGIPPHRNAPADGAHGDFAQPGWRISSVNTKIKAELARRWPGMDIRAEKAYANFTGRTERGQYEWLRDPTAHPFELLPKNLQEFLGLPASPGNNGAAPVQVDPAVLVQMALARIPSLGRNSAGFWLSVQLRDNRFDQTTALEVLRGYRTLCPPVNRKGEAEPYTEAEMLASIAQAYSRSPREPWDTGEEGKVTEADAPNEEPPGASKRSRHFMNTGGAVFHVDEESGARTFVCSYLTVEAYARDANSESWGRLLKWTDSVGKEHSWIVPMRMLVGDGISLRETLADGGVSIGIAPKKNHLLTQYIWTQYPDRFLFCVPHTGWFGRCFVLPESVIPSDADVGYQSLGRGEHFYRTAGTLESWREEIGRKCIGNSRLMFAVSAALAGPFLRPLNIQGGGFHFRATSSMGKSTTQWVAGSIWGGGGRLGFARTWATTKNAIESIAELHNDGCLILDEIRLIDPREVEQIVYMLANGIGKARETRSITGRRTLQWTLMLISSGEIPLSDCAALAGQKIKGGAEIRMATIPAEVEGGMGVFERLYGTEDPRIFAESLEAAAKQHYGLPIRIFIAYVIDNWDRLIKEAAEFIEGFINDNLPTGAAPEVRRVLRRFAVSAYAGETATEAGITGWKDRDATAATIACFEAWLQERGGVDATDTRNALHQVREIIAASHGRFYAADPAYDKEGDIIREHISNSLGYWKEIDGETVYLVSQDAFRTVLCARFDKNHVAKELRARKLLKLGQQDRWTYRTEITLPTGTKERPWFYAIRAHILEIEI
jgi:putative DNA primase/helicase